MNIFENDTYSYEEPLGDSLKSHLRHTIRSNIYPFLLINTIRIAATILDFPRIVKNMTKKYSRISQSKDEFSQKTKTINVDVDTELDDLNCEYKSQGKPDFLGEEKYHEEPVKISSN